MPCGIVYDIYDDVYDVYDDSRRNNNDTNTPTSDIMKEPHQIAQYHKCAWCTRTGGVGCSSIVCLINPRFC